MTRIRVFRMFAIALLTITVVCSAKFAHAQYSVLYYFGTGGSENPPENPVGAIAQGRDGSLYGTTNSGGANNAGTVFKITPAGKLLVLYSFCSQASCADGSSPIGGLTLRPDGHFIGTTSAGASHNAGTIFDITQTGSLITLYTFTGLTDGGAPQAAPILGPDGAFYGTTRAGGAPSGCGTIYRLSATFSVLHDFNRVLGCEPLEPLVLGTDGNFYGTTIGGGKAGSGVIFQATYRPGKAPLFTVLADLSNEFDGDFLLSPQSSLIQGSDGNFYGTSGGGADNENNGVVFKMTPGGDITVLHNLNGTTDGGSPAAGLVQASDGNFYGSASTGGSTSGDCIGEGCGTLFQLTPSGAFSVFYTFDFFTGNQPSTTPMFQHTDGLLYGEAGGGVGLSGVFFSWNGSLPPFVSTVQSMGAVGSPVEILGQGFTSTTTVSFNGVAASATVQSGTSLTATVPAGAATGFITVTTSSGTLTSNKQFVVTP
jgi:uncharacterized repeat protein (TIGR03803 family)